MTINIVFTVAGGLCGHGDSCTLDEESERVIAHVLASARMLGDCYIVATAGYSERYRCHMGVVMAARLREKLGSNANMVDKPEYATVFNTEGEGQGALASYSQSLCRPRR